MAGGSFAQFLDRNYRYQRHIYDFTREYYLLGRDTLIAGLATPEGGSILEIGCGTARNLILASERYPHADLYGIDLSRAMLETAQRKLAHRGLLQRIHLGYADAVEFRPQELFGREAFDRIFFSYSISMIPAWQKALRHAASLLTPQGSLHIVDFGRGCDLPRALDWALDAWLQRFHVTRRLDLQPELRRIAGEIGGDLYFAELYRSYAAYAVLRLR